MWDNIQSVLIEHHIYCFTRTLRYFKLDLLLLSCSSSSVVSGCLFRSVSRSVSRFYSSSTLVVILVDRSSDPREVVPHIWVHPWPVSSATHITPGNNPYRKTVSLLINRLTIVVMILPVCKLCPKSHWLDRSFIYFNCYIKY